MTCESISQKQTVTLSYSPGNVDGLPPELRRQHDVVKEGALAPRVSSSSRIYVDDGSAGNYTIHQGPIKGNYDVGLRKDTGFSDS